VPSFGKTSAQALSILRKSLIGQKLEYENQYNNQKFRCNKCNVSVPQNHLTSRVNFVAVFTHNKK